MSIKYYDYMAEQIMSEISSVKDPAILNLYLRAIIIQRCKIGTSQQDTCIGCTFTNYQCRQLFDACEIEKEIRAEDCIACKSLQKREEKEVVCE